MLKQKSEDESKSDDASLISAVLSFGKVTERNRQKLVETVGEERVEEMRTFVDKICAKKSRRKREADNELLMYDRIILFERFCRLEEMPAIKRSGGLPRKWRTNDDIKLQELLETSGLTDTVLKELGVCEEVALNRIKVLVDASVDDE